MPAPPPLPYAPRRTRPLSLWNPLDYLLLLGWVFFFPQALRWYAETFGRYPQQRWGRAALREDRVQRRLYVQGVVLAVGVPAGVWCVSVLLNTQLSPLGVASGVWSGLVLGLAAGVLVETLFDLQTGVPEAVAVMVPFSVVGGITFGLAGSLPDPSWIPMAGAVAFGGAAGLAVNAGRGASAGVARGMATAIAFGGLLGVAAGLAVGVTVGLTKGEMVGWGAGLITGVVVLLLTTLGVLRPDVAALGLITGLGWPASGPILPHCSPLPIPELGRRLRRRLAADWAQGLDECEGLLRYSLQFILVVHVLHQALAHLPPEVLLPRIAEWCSRPLHDWRVVFYQSASLRIGMWERFLYGLLVPARWRTLGTLRTDTPARAACAGFWWLQEGNAAAAALAFDAVRPLRGGVELFNNATALDLALNCKTLADIADWTPPPPPATAELRVPVRTAFVLLSEVAQDVRRVGEPSSIRQRNSALNRAAGALAAFPLRISECCTPERPILNKIAEHWLKLVLDHAGAIGKLEVRSRVFNPYIVGPPVPALRLVGRADIFTRLQGFWETPHPRASLVIYGHRRMGKTSIARNLEELCQLGADTSVAVLNLQQVVWAEQLASLCYNIAAEMHNKALATVEDAPPLVLPEPQPQDYERYPVARLAQFFALLHRADPTRRYILILDEFELLDRELSKNDFMSMLRALTQTHPWLAIGLVGLHTLKERAAGFYEAIYGWPLIKVGLLDADGVAKLLQVELDLFPLEYDSDALQMIYEFTGGQPFLVQLLGHSLVERFNAQLLTQLDPPEPMFSATAVLAVVNDADFYQHGDGYFRGVWQQARGTPPGQPALLWTLATAGELGMARQDFQQASSLPPAAFQAALQALIDHDVVSCDQDTCRYTIELMRRWVAQHTEERPLES